MNKFKVKSKLWLYPGLAAWYFVSIPKKQSSEIKTRFGDMARGWGSLPVKITIGKTQWQTSIFPDKKEGTYLLPIKAQIRKLENLKVNDAIALDLEILI